MGRPGERPRHGPAIPNITLNELHRGIEPPWSGSVAVHLFDQAVENPNPVSAGQQRVREMTADKAGTPRDEGKIFHEQTRNSIDRCKTTNINSIETNNLCSNL
ncbi:hypothetical protein MPPM_1262 [Methylorubrum populi]|uniref:Uncharacterized protein n=1 Tax=Methylorubrum populi TaxID=223967 RepID=A0A160PAT7_9HYPH|nr:hypothetical protein MPPM_1262 [Methylorubrum populi]